MIRLLSALRRRLGRFSGTAEDLRELAAGIHTVPGGLRDLCISCTKCLATQPHPDGGPGGVCIECWMLLTPTPEAAPEDDT